jgi:hypothetical protein
VTGRLDYAHHGPLGAAVGWGRLLLRLDTLPVYPGRDPEYATSVWAADGAEVARLSCRLPGLEFARGWQYVAAGADRAVALVDDGSGLFRVRPLDGYLPEMWFYASQGGRVMAGTAPERLAVWRDGNLYHTLDCDGTGYTAWPSDDGRLLTLVYDPGHLGIPAGVLDLATSEVVGRCDWHMFVFGWAYSRSNRYMASLMTDSQYNTHAGLGSGTVVVTELSAV